MLDGVAKSITLVKDLSTIAALVIGGIWTYALFVAHREDHLQATIEQQLRSVSVTDQFRVIQVSVTIKNVGRAWIHGPREGVVWVQQIAPLLECIRPDACPATQLAAWAQNPSAQDKDRFDWPKIAERRLLWNSGERQLDIEPGESDTVNLEFALPSTTRSIRVYAYIDNPLQDASESTTTKYARGWSSAAFYTFGGEK